MKLTEPVVMAWGEGEASKYPAPSLPLAPAGPVLPVSPVSPLSPLAPALPVAPVGPTLPVAPVAPGIPALPLFPGMPAIEKVQSEKVPIGAPKVQRSVIEVFGTKSVT